MVSINYLEDEFHNPIVNDLRAKIKAKEIESGFMVNRENLKIFYRIWSDSKVTSMNDLTPKGNIILNVHGVSSHSEMSINMADGLVDKNTIVCAFDFIGHGHSDGIRGDYTRFKMFIENIEDIAQFLRETFPQRKLILSGESMGALAVVLYILIIYNRQSNIYRTYLNIDKLIFWAPAFGPNFDTGWSKDIGYIVKLGLNLILDSGKISIPVDHKKTFQNKSALRIHDDHPYVLKKYSARYLTTINLAMKKLKKFGFSQDLKIPFLIIHGSKDYLVSQKSSYNFYTSSPLREEKNEKKYILIDNCWHHIYSDPNFRKEYWDEIKNWLKLGIKKN